MILSLHILFTDELGQLSAEDISLYDIILRNVRKSTVFMGGLLVIGTLDHLQIQPIVGRPFLTANCVIPCFKMVSLQHSVIGHCTKPIYKKCKMTRICALIYEF